MTASKGWPIRTSYAEIKPASWFLAHPMNFRLPNAEHSSYLDASLDELGWVKPVIVNRRTAPEWGPEQGVETLLDGHERIRKALQAGDDTPVPLDWVDLPPHLEPIALAILDEMVTYRQKDREKLAMLIEDAKPANAALQQMLANMAEKEGLYQGNGQRVLEDVQPQIDRAAELQEQWGTAIGQLWEIPSLTVAGKSHWLRCGDSTQEDQVQRLMHGIKATLCHADPPYGMGKEREGIANDNLYREKLDAFQLTWWAAARSSLEDNASVYIWGTAEDLWRLWYVSGLRATERLTFRNELVWDKGSVETNPTMLVAGVPLESRRMYQPTERCFFFMLGEQGFSTNADNYWEGWEPIRSYLEGERLKMGWDIPTMKRIVGHSDLQRDHWTSKSQWSFPTREVYEALRQASKDNGFKKDYEDFKKDYEDLKKDYYATRAYFDNTHDNMTDVWPFPRVSGEERHDHPTPKPIAMIARIVKSSCPAGKVVYDPFIGSGTTIVACEQIGRVGYACDVEPKWIAVTLQRLADMGLEPRLVES